VAPTPEAARELWRWLLDFDWTSEFHANFLPLDHELFMLLAEPRRLEFKINDGVWVRLVDVGQALSARTYNDGEIVLEVDDALLPENAGRWRVTSSGAERTEDAADLRLDITGLGSVYLGGFTFAALVRGSRAQELTDGAADRGDALFCTNIEPWCPEIF
jgi:predicted acetyltransferase